MSELLAYFRRNFLEFKHYKIMTLCFFLVPIFSVLKWYLTGEFVKEIIFYNKAIKYFYFLVFSMFIADFFYHGFDAIIRRFYRAKSLYECLLRGFKKIMFYKLITYVLDVYLSNLPLILLISFFFTIDLQKFLVVLLLSIIIVLPGISYALLFSPLLMYFRGEEQQVIIRIFRIISYIFIPIQFSFYLFSNYKIIEILVPSVGIVEELRKYLFLEEMDLQIFLLATLVSIAYFTIGVLIFVKVLNYARLKGWIGLK